MANESQRETIQAYAAKRSIQISDWIEEHVSASKTELSERKLSSLISSQQSLIVSDITKLGRQKGQKVKSKLDEHTAFILNLLDAKTSKAEILRK